MAKNAKDQGCCSVEAVVTVDSRGQIVLPKELRSAAGIRAGDKLAVVAMQSEGRVCCLSLMKVEQLAGTVKDILGPWRESWCSEKQEGGGVWQLT